MTEINDLRERVEAAEARFGLIDEQQQHYSERLIGLIETIEAQLAAARSEIEIQIAENKRLSQENEELRGMLHSVLRSVEQKTFTKTLQDLEARVSTLVTGAAGAEPTAPAAETAPEANNADEHFVGPADALVETAAEPAEEEDAPLILDGTATEPGDDTSPADNDEPMVLEADEAPEDAVATSDPAVHQEPAAPETPEEALNTPETALGDATFEDEPAAAMRNVTFEDEPQAATENLSIEDAPEDVAGVDDAPNVDAAGEDGGFEVAAMEASEDAGEGPPAAEAAGTESYQDNAVAEALEEHAVAMPAAADTTPAAPDEAPRAVPAGRAALESAPSVKEIIRRVGDLARELEKAETERKASGGTAPAAGEDEEAGPGAPPLDPPLHRAVNG